MALDTSLLNTQHFKVIIKSEVEQSKERSSALPYGVVAIENGAFWSTSTKGRQQLLLVVVESDQKAPFWIAATPRCRAGRNSFPWIAPLYRWYVLYIAEW